MTGENFKRFHREDKLRSQLKKLQLMHSKAWDDLCYALTMGDTNQASVCHQKLEDLFEQIENLKFRMAMRWC